MKEIYISTDIESDGPVPGIYSMLSFGSVALTLDKEIISTFSANLECLPGAMQDPPTMEWWSTQKEAWIEARRDPQDPALVMKRYVSWLKSLDGKPVFVGYPAGFDFMYIYWYLIKFAGESPFTFLCCDIKSYAQAVLKKPFYEITKSTMPKAWFDSCNKTHVALDDAIEQGFLFCNMVNENLAKK